MSHTKLELTQFHLSFLHEPKDIPMEEARVRRLKLQKDTRSEPKTRRNLTSREGK
jgi:hypothetical protein